MDPDAAVHAHPREGGDGSSTSRSSTRATRCSGWCRELHRHERLVLARRQAGTSRLRRLRPRSARRRVRERDHGCAPRQDALEQLDLRSYVKTSGAAGIHVLVPITRRWTLRRDVRVRRASLAQRRSGEPGPRDDRVAEEEAADGAVLVDHRQNGARQDDRVGLLGSAAPGAPVSTPLGWEELTEAVRPRDFGMTECSRESSGSATSTSSRCGAASRSPRRCAHSGRAGPTGRRR